MKKSSMTLLSLIALSGSSFGDSAAAIVSGAVSSSGTHQFSQGGLINNLSLCNHELCFRDESGLLKISPVAAGSMSAIVSQASEPNGGKFLVFYPVGEQRNPNARRILRTRYIVTLAEGADLQEVQQRCGIGSAKLAREGSNLVICEEDSSGKVLAQLSLVAADPDVLSAEPVFAKKVFKRLIPTDPFYDTVDNPRADESYQWYLNNIGVNGGLADIDINLEDALDRANGTGVTIGVIDDGLSIDHADLAAGTAAGPHLNLLDGDPDDPTTFDAALTHGTSIASLIAARFNNGEGMSGVAPNASLSGIRMLDATGLSDDIDQATALSFENNIIDIYNASWGTDDTTLNFDAPGTFTQSALQTGVTSGRDGLGNVFVWAAGNGGEIGDNSNYDGYANSRFTIAVGAVTDAGIRAAYSERGANVVVVAPSDGGEQGVLAASYGLDVDDDDLPIRTTEYVNDFGGTSASAALVSGVVALMLDETPQLSWRDVQDILIRTASKVDAENPEWEENAAGFEFNPNYGAGLVDAAAAVQEAFVVANENNFLGAPERHIRSEFFSSVPSSDPSVVSGIVPDNTGGSLLVNFDMATDAAGNDRDNLRVEHVEFRATIITESRSDLEIVLISPNGTTSTLQEVDLDHDEQSIFRWNFMTVRNWGEGSAGTWVVRITDRVTGDAAVLNNASLIINGSVDPDAPINQIPILTSSRVIDVNQGSAFTYTIETSGATGIEVENLPPGFVYDPVAQTISGVPTQPGLFTIPVTLTDSEGAEGVFVINVVVRPTAIALGDAVGLPGVPAVFEGDVPWDFELTDTNDGDVSEPRAARSAIGMEDGQTSSFGFDGLESGVLLFDWKTSSEEGFDRLWFNRGGDVPQVWEAFISGEREWGRSAVILPDVSNDVRWIYTKDASESVGEDRGLVDNVELVPLDKYLQDVKDAANIEGFDFELDSRALFIPTELDGATPPPGGVAISSIMTPSIGNGQTVSLSGWVDGPGNLSFISVVYAEAVDVLELLVDGVVVGTSTGNGAVFSPTFPIVEGRHRVQIRFRKSFTGSNGAVWARGTGLPFDGALIDELKFIPTNSFSTFMADYGDGDPDGDADNDGYSNHQEYAFGGNPVNASVVPAYVPQVVEANGGRFIEYGVNPNRQDLTYVAQQSSDLENWQEAELSTLHRTEGDYEVYRIPVQSVQGRRNLFYRVIANTK